MSLVGRHLRRHRFRLGVNYGVTGIENVLELLYPFAAGLAVDDLLRDSSRGLVFFAVLWTVHAAVGAVREWYAARLFARLYAELASDLALDNRRLGIDSSATVARSALALEFVDFFQLNVDVAITAGFAFAGSLVLITLYDVPLGAAALALAVPFALLNVRMFRRSARIVGTLNDEFELEAAVLSNGSDEEVERHYHAMAHDQIRLDRTHTATWATLEAFVVLLVTFSFIRATDITDQPGTIYAIVAYVWAYVGSFDELPSLVQQISGLRDIVRRLDNPTGAR